MRSAQLRFVFAPPPRPFVLTRNQRENVGLFLAVFPRLSDGTIAAVCKVPTRIVAELRATRVLQPETVTRRISC